MVDSADLTKNESHYVSYDSQAGIQRTGFASKPEADAHAAELAQEGVRRIQVKSESDIDKARARWMEEVRASNPPAAPLGFGARISELFADNDTLPPNFDISPLAKLQMLFTGRYPKSIRKM